MKKFILPVLLGMFSLAHADDGLLSSLDKDKDGAVSEAEASDNADIAAQFKSLDANGDGKLDQKELGGN